MSDAIDSLVAFIDILGFKDIVMSDTQKAESVIDDIDDKMQSALNALKEEDMCETSARLFSDCMCLSCKNDLQNIYSFLYQIAYLQFYFSIMDIYIRGGLSTGLHFENERIIFSKALVRAYEIEKLAIYPRIIIDKNIINSINNLTNETKKKECYDLILQSPDGHYFVDYLQIIFEIGHVEDDMILMHKNSIIKQVNANHNKSAVLDKYRWLAEYHNTTLMRKIDPEDYDINYYNEIIEEQAIDIKKIFPSFRKL